MTSLSSNKRRSGILLHPTSLPSGTLDDDVDHWLNLLVETGYRVWQVLPLGEPQIGLSPYQCSSAFAINPALLNSYSAVDVTDKHYLDFCDKQRYWLDDYVLFKILKLHFKGVPWVDWPSQWQQHKPLALLQTSQQYKEQIDSLKWQQFQLYERWQAIRIRAAELDILLFGDMPIYIGHDSADVWAHPENFLLNSDGQMEVVSGVPPDYFSETGQRWGNPHYNWDTMRGDNFSWWRSRIDHHLDMFDLVRIDHFRGLEAAWVIDASCETAVDGQWQKMPGDELLTAIRTELIKTNRVETVESTDDAQLPFVAEDLGIITTEVTALRKKYHLPGMSVLQFGFDAFDDNPHKPHNITTDKVVYTGTHDNDTTVGWFNSLEDTVKQHVLQTLGLNEIDPGDKSTADQVVERLIDNAMFSQAELCIIPLQDCLHLGSQARMNAPGTTTGNWTWQFQWSQIEQAWDEETKQTIRNLNRKSNRLAGSEV